MQATVWQESLIINFLLTSLRLHWEYVTLGLSCTLRSVAKSIASFVREISPLEYLVSNIFLHVRLTCKTFGHHFPISNSNKKWFHMGHLMALCSCSRILLNFDVPWWKYDKLCRCSTLKTERLLAFSKLSYKIFMNTIQAQYENELRMITCWATTDRTSSSIRLNSSKHAQAPQDARPLKN